MPRRPRVREQRGVGAGAHQRRGAARVVEVHVGDDDVAHLLEDIPASEGARSAGTAWVVLVSMKATSSPSSRR